MTHHKSGCPILRTVSSSAGWGSNHFAATAPTFTSCRCTSLVMMGSLWLDRGFGSVEFEVAMILLAGVAVSFGQGCGQKEVTC